MKKLVLACAMASLACSAAMAAGPQKLTFSVHEPPQAFGPTQVYGPWANDISAASQGTVKIEMLAGGQLGPAKDQLDLVQNRVADMALVIPGFTPGRFKGNDITELPFLWRDPSQAGIAVARLIAAGQLKYPGVKVLGVAVTGPYQVHSDKKVASLGDMRGLRIRASGPISAAVASALGATPVGLPAPSVAENISRGVLDGTFLDWALLKVFRIIDATPYHFEYPLGGTISLIVMNKDVWAALPDKAKAAFDKYGPEDFAARWGNVIKAQDKAVAEQAKADTGQTIVDPDKAEVDRWTKALTPVVSEWSGKSPENKALLEVFQQALASVRAN